ncbi:MAG TPA: GTPase Era [Tenericutes bacterium]|nr:GTPase Era [Mycoplasmatota bacterium]
MSTSFFYRGFKMKSGFVSLIGRPNVGKSTLINSIVGKKVAITSDKPQTTRNTIQGIYNDDDTQIVFVDTPGIHKPNHKLGTYLNRQAYYSIKDVDIILFLVEATSKIGPGDKFILNQLKDLNKTIFLIINKIDKISKEELLIRITEYKDLLDFNEIIPVSALKKDNINQLIKVLKNYLPDEIAYYDKNDYTNKSKEFIMAEIIREKVFELTHEEVPHSLTCIIETIEKKKDKFIIYAAIIVDRDSLKKIIIGNKGSKIKEIGVKARKELEELIGKKVYLNLFIKTIKNWRDKEKYFSELGFNDLE